ncbi:hypothetical protein DYB28_001729, partial [Aphanomyces astaci]
MQANFGPEVDLPSHINLKQPMKTPYRHYSKLKSTLHQLVRDWAVEVGMNQQKVLVPGAGLGRLALEIVSAGYATQGNEFSYQMLFTSGVWINLGPLLYHWQNGSGADDDRYDQSIELSYEEIKHVAEGYNFKFT